MAGTVDDDGPSAVADTPIGAISIDDQRADRDDRNVQVLVRPEQIALSSWTSADSSVGEGAVVTAVEYYGHDVRYELELDDGTTLAARTHSTELFSRGRSCDSHLSEPAAQLAVGRVLDRAATSRTPALSPAHRGPLRKLRL